MNPSTFAQYRAKLTLGDAATLIAELRAAGDPDVSELDALLETDFLPERAAARRSRENLWKETPVPRRRK